MSAKLGTSGLKAGEHVSAQLLYPKDGTRPYLLPTDKLVPMRGPKSNARLTRVYVVPADL
jgi:hypothetical protein